MLTSVIYKNDSGTATLLDLPASIQNGQRLQCNEPIQAVDRMLSAGAPAQPYPNIEPKGLKRGKMLEGIPQAEQEYHQRLQAFISNSLQEIRSALGQRQWLLPRQTLVLSYEERLQVTQKTKANKVTSETPVILSSISNIFSSSGDIADRLVSNPYDLCTRLVVGSHAYHIPPRSTFILSDVSQFGAVTEAFSKKFIHGCFDFIIMDPPWSNRSVRHAKAYETSESRSEDPFLCVLPILNSHVRADGLVGIWVTNKASIRQLVLDSLHRKGFRLYKEWVWMKATANGDPVTPLDGLWRRPYEVFLLFHRRQSPKCSTADASEQAGISTFATAVPWHVLVAVPGHHSQKPCLKEFIEPLLNDPTDYQALEIFARNLTAGWCSWGDEVLKFNCEAHWARVK